MEEIKQRPSTTTPQAEPCRPNRKKKFALLSSSFPPDWRRRPQHPHTLHEQHLESRVYVAHHRPRQGMKRKDSPYRFPMQGRPIVLVRRRFVGSSDRLSAGRLGDPPGPSFVRPGVRTDGANATHSWPPLPPWRVFIMAESSFHLHNNTYVDAF